MSEVQRVTVISGLKETKKSLHLLRSYVHEQTGSECAMDLIFGESIDLALSCPADDVWRDIPKDYTPQMLYFIRDTIETEVAKSCNCGSELCFVIPYILQGPGTREFNHCKQMAIQEYRTVLSWKLPFSEVRPAIVTPVGNVYSLMVH